jgi:hypothetical protein
VTEGCPLYLNCQLEVVFVTALYLAPLFTNRVVWLKPHTRTYHTAAGPQVYETRPPGFAGLGLESHQVAKSTNGVKPTFRGTANELIAEHGVKGFTRGVIPRMLNTALWGTAMVSAYEFLKRMSVLED